MYINLKNTINNFFPNKGVLILFGIAILLVILVLTLALSGVSRNSENNNSFSPTPTPLIAQGGLSTEQKIAPTQKSIIEKSTVEEIENIVSVENKSTLPNGSIRYTFTSPLMLRKNEVIVQNNRVIFERILVPESSNDPGYVTISEYKGQYDQPQRVITGSHFYGHHVETYIYADKGFTLIGNPFTDEVFEIHVYIPTTVENYIEQYGEDIEESSGYVL